MGTSDVSGREDEMTPTKSLLPDLLDEVEQGCFRWMRPFYVLMKDVWGTRYFQLEQFDDFIENFEATVSHHFALPKTAFENYNSDKGPQLARIEAKRSLDLETVSESTLIALREILARKNKTLTLKYLNVLNMLVFTCIVDDFDKGDTLERPGSLQIAAMRIFPAFYCLARIQSPSGDVSIGDFTRYVTEYFRTAHPSAAEVNESIKADFEVATDVVSRTNSTYVGKLLNLLDEPLLKVIKQDSKILYPLAWPV